MRRATTQPTPEHADDEVIGWQKCPISSAVLMSLNASVEFGLCPVRGTIAFGVSVPMGSPSRGLNAERAAHPKGQRASLGGNGATGQPSPARGVCGDREEASCAVLIAMESFFVTVLHNLRIDLSVHSTICHEIFAGNAALGGVV